MKMERQMRRGTVSAIQHSTIILLFLLIIIPYHHPTNVTHFIDDRDEVFSKIGMIMIMIREDTQSG